MKPRPILVDGPVAYIELTKGHTAIIDTEDIYKVSKYSWCAHQVRKSELVYGITNLPRVNGKKKMQLLHRLILDNPKEYEVDHIDGNGLNNKKENLRLATRKQNAHNCKKPVNNTSGIKGVSKEKLESTQHI